MVGLALVALAPGTSTFLTNLSAAIAKGLEAVLYFALENVLKALVVSLVLDFAAEQLGSEAMAILAAVVVVVAGYKAFGGKGMLVEKLLPNAAKLLGLASSMLSSANKVIGSELKELTKDYADFLKEKEEKESLLEEYSELIDEINPDALDLLNAQAYSTQLEQPMVNDPGEFYDLAIHTGNPGVLSLDCISVYTNLALTLPKPATSSWA